METAQTTGEILAQSSLARERPRVSGKFLFVGDEKFWVRGVSYGTFRLDERGNESFAPEVAEKDFQSMAENGFNVIRTYTVPPRWLLDLAQKHGLRMMIGLPWEGEMAFLDEEGRAEEIESRVRGYVRLCARHPAVFCYAIGNEIPSSVVRWHGRRRIEKFLHRLYRVVKEEDPGALATYVNFPTTEYLRLPFLDFLSVNVYLESKQALEDYLARLHSLSNERPLLITEVGLDSRRNGEGRQAEVLDWQVSSIFSSGCCGVVIFSWTDEWYRSGHSIEDWGFGLTTRDRRPKPALGAVRAALAKSPFPTDIRWPKVSVVVCSFNGARTIRDTLDALQKLDYPDFEVIVVNDGSTDSTARVASAYPFKLVSTENRGLAQARNTGIEASTGEIVAFVDDDAYPDPDWLRFLALRFMEGEYVGVGGPNLPPENDGWQADVVANAPGPNPVLISDRVAEHIPGCNMAFRRDSLNEIGGFDPIFRAAGDDVDLCWRLREGGGVIGFSPSAVVWHHRRNSIYGYWKQQAGYGKAEALLEMKWPEKYNTAGQVSWSGRIYGRGVSLDFLPLRKRVYQGVWGTAPFQSIYPSSGSLLSLTLMPEWYLLVALLSLLFLASIGSLLSLIFGSLLLASIALPVAEASVTAIGARFPGEEKFNPARRLALLTLTALLHLLQPLARLRGRMGRGLTPLRRRGASRGRGALLPLTVTMWRYEWEDQATTLRELQARLRGGGAIVRSGGGSDSWDLEVRGGLFGGSRLLLAIEEHGAGKQFLRFRVSPRYSRFAAALGIPSAAISLTCAALGAWVACVASGLVAIIVITRAMTDVGFASGILREALREPRSSFVTESSGRPR